MQANYQGWPAFRCLLLYMAAGKMLKWRGARAAGARWHCRASRSLRQSCSAATTEGHALRHPM